MAIELTVEGVEAGYGTVRVLHGVSLNVREGETVALLGTNGNGKSTLLKCIMGIVRPESGRIDVEIDGEKIDLVGLAPREVVERGIGLVPEGRRLFPRLTVEENLTLGAFRGAARALLSDNLAFCFEAFPVLAQRRRQLAGSMSGGEQQMLAIARALMAMPRLLLLDEPSAGLAPIIVDHLAEIILGMNESGLTVLLVEQNAYLALELARKAYVMESGRVVESGDTEVVMESDLVRRAYLGI